MNKIELEEFQLIGLALPGKTTNENGQSGIDCGSLWQKFENGNYAEKIPGKSGDEIYAVYHEYEGDHTRPFSYFIGCKVGAGMQTPEGMDSLTIPSGRYQKIVSSGQMPDCLVNSWKGIWSSGIRRAYQADFEVYDERSRDWNNAEVDIFISIEE